MINTHTLMQSPIWMYFFKKETLSFILDCLLDLRNHVQREIWLSAVAIIQHKKNAVSDLWIDLMCPGSVSALRSQWGTCEFKLCNSTTDSPAPVVLKWPWVSLNIPLKSARENVPVTIMVLPYHRTFCILFAQNKTWVINKGYTISELLLMSLSISMIMYCAALNDQFRLWEALYLNHSIQCSINVITLSLLSSQALDPKFKTTQNVSIRKTISMYCFDSKQIFWPWNHIRGLFINQGWVLGKVFTD